MTKYVTVVLTTVDDSRATVLVEVLRGTLDKLDLPLPQTDWAPGDWQVLDGLPGDGHSVRIVDLNPGVHVAH